MKQILILILLIFGFSTVQAQLENHPKHVILIGIDGLGAYAFPEAKLSSMNSELSQEELINARRKLHSPTFNMLMKNGSYSLKARSVLPSSSAANWASMIMGAGPELHGYTKWDSQEPELPSRELDKFGLFPSIFTLLREQKPKSEIGAIYTWGGVSYLLPKKALNKNLNPKNDELTTEAAIQYIEEKKPEFLFVHYSDVDGVGHRTGHGTPSYYKGINTIDSYIKRIIETVQKAGMEDDTVIIVSSDHGGKDKGHGGKTMQEMKIPWIAYGKALGHQGKIEKSIVTYDTAATIAWLFGLETPQVWTGRPVKQIFY